MIITTIQIRCDDCGRLYRGPDSRGATGAQVRTAALEEGWQTSLPHGRDYCPEHRHTPGGPRSKNKG